MSVVRLLTRYIVPLFTEEYNDTGSINQQSILFLTMLCYNNPVKAINLQITRETN